MLRELAEYIAKEWRVLSGAPFSFIILAVLCLLGGLGLASWHYSGQISTLSGQVTSKDGEISRYRVALGIDKASKGAMVELTNEELYARAVSLTSSVRGLCVLFDKRQAEFAKTFKSNKKSISEAEYNVALEITTDYEKSYRSDVTLMLNELLRRLDPKATAAIVRYPIGDADTGTPIDVLTLSPGGHNGAAGRTIEMSLLCPIADELEQLSKLLSIAKR